MADDNPFADPANINPFADPAVQAATGSAPQTEEYNPFADEPKQGEPEPIRLPPPPSKAEVKAKEKEKKKDKPKSKPPTKKASEPAIMEPDDPPEYTPAPSSFRDPETEKLREREEEIARREAALKDRERNMDRLGPGETPKNFPPFPKCCPAPFKPCFYISIKTEIPPSEHGKVYSLLALMIYLWILLLVNLIFAIAGAITAGSVNNGILTEALTTMGVAIAYFVLYIPGSLFCWFLPVYHAYRKDSSLAFMWFFFVMAFQILSFLLGAIGIPNLGACGWFNGARLFATAPGMDQTPGQAAIGAVFIILGFLWFLGIVPSVILLILVHRYYRTSGGSINKAVAEGVKGAAKNEAVKGAVKSTVKAGVRSAMSDDK